MSDYKPWDYQNILDYRETPADRFWGDLLSRWYALAGQSLFITDEWVESVSLSCSVCGCDKDETPDGFCRHCGKRV